LRNRRSASGNTPPLATRRKFMQRGTLVQNSDVGRAAP
jgi:hypothetical protein